MAAACRMRAAAVAIPQRKAHGTRSITGAAAREMRGYVKEMQAGRRMRSLRPGADACAPKGRKRPIPAAAGRNRDASVRRGCQSP